MAWALEDNQEERSESGLRGCNHYDVACVAVEYVRSWVCAMEIRTYAVQLLAGAGPLVPTSVSLLRVEGKLSAIYFPRCSHFQETRGDITSRYNIAPE